MKNLLHHITLDSGKLPQHSIIWLHGLGADGNDFVPVVDKLNLPFTVRFIFPHAPQRPVTINGGYIMRAWYDIAGQTIDTKQDEPGIRTSQAAIEALITQEVERGVPHKNIFLAGFSQGGAIALHTGLRQAIPLGGVLALSTYLPLSKIAANEVLPTTKATPFFMAHGNNDSVVPFSLGISSRDTLIKLGYNVEWHNYNMQHSVCEQELLDIQTWLSKQLN